MEVAWDGTSLEWMPGMVSIQSGRVNRLTTGSARKLTRTNKVVVQTLKLKLKIFSNRQNSTH
jgi:hypothetical protein